MRKTKGPATHSSKSYDYSNRIEINESEIIRHGQTGHQEPKDDLTADKLPCQIDGCYKKDYEIAWNYVICTFHVKIISISKL